MKIADRMKHVSYPIRDVVVKANEVEARGKKVDLKLNIGDPNAYDFDCPDFLKKEFYKAVAENRNGYAASEGFAGLRKAVAESDRKKGVDTQPEHVVITAGLSEALSMISACLIEKGMNALLPTPCYPLYPSTILYEGGTPLFFNTPEENAFEPDVDDLRKKITKDTAFVLINNPCNPTGTIYSEKKTKQLLDVCAETDTLVVADEIYDELVFDAPFKRAASINHDVPILSLNGLSKNFSAPGWRVGWVAFHNFKEYALKEAMLKLCRLRLSAPYPAQVAGAAALNNPEFGEFNRQMCDKLKKRRDLSTKRLNEIEGLSCVKPGGAFYAFPQIHSDKWKDDKQFVYELLEEKGVLTVFGSGFYAPGKHFRIVFLPPEETLTKAFDGIEDFMKKKL